MQLIPPAGVGYHRVKSALFRTNKPAEVASLSLQPAQCSQPWQSLSARQLNSTRLSSAFPVHLLTATTVATAELLNTVTTTSRIIQSFLLQHIHITVPLLQVTSRHVLLSHPSIGKARLTFQLAKPNHTEEPAQLFATLLRLKCNKLSTPLPTLCVWMPHQMFSNTTPAVLLPPQLAEPPVTTIFSP